MTVRMRNFVYIILIHKTACRYFGLTKLVIINGSDPSNFTYEAAEDRMWGKLANPFVILVAYYFLAIEARELFKPKVRHRQIQPTLRIYSAINALKMINKVLICFSNHGFGCYLTNAVDTQL